MDFKSVKVIKKQGQAEELLQTRRGKGEITVTQSWNKRQPTVAKMEKVTSGQYTNSYCTSVNFLFLPLCCGGTKMLTLGEASKLRTIGNCSDFIFAVFLYFFLSVQILK